MTMSEVKGPCWASAITALSVQSPTGFSVWISMLLLLIFSQVFTSLWVFAGVFIRSSDFLISPFGICLTHENVKTYCYSVWGAELEMKNNIVETGVILALYIPVVLVAFALLAMLFAAYAKDRAALWFSMICQAASSFLILAGIIGFLLINQEYVSMEDMTLWFYMCVGVQVELVITTLLTSVAGRRLMTDWI